MGVFFHNEHTHPVGGVDVLLGGLWLWPTFLDQNSLIFLLISGELCQIAGRLLKQCAVSRMDVP